jgi:integrase
MAKAKKLKSGNWRAQVFAGYKKDKHGAFVLNKKTGKKIPAYESITGTDKTEVEYLAAQYKRDRSANSTPSEYTVKQAMDRYIESRSNVLSPTTIQGYKKMAKHNLQGIVGIKLKKLTQDDVQNAVNKDALTLTSKTIHNAHGFLSAVLSAYRPNMKLTTSLKGAKKHIKELPQPQAIFDAVRGTRIELAALLAMWLSFSMSEIRGIMKSDIKDGVLTLNRVIVDVDNSPIVKDEMKEYARTRRHIIPSYIMNLIDSCKSEYIVPMNAHQIDYWWEKARNNAGLPHITFHDLRHVNASVMHLLHIPDKYAMERGGWKTDATMKAVYQNVFSEERKKADSVIDEYFNDIVKSV